jgi:hypothetical protein
MRRLRQSRARSMARRLGGEPRVELTPRVRTIAGWIVAILIVVGAAFFVGRLGSPDAPGNAGSGSDASPAPTLPAIAFGTGLDAATGEVATDLQTARFAAGDVFVYSVRPAGPPGTDELYVEVIRLGPDQTSTPVQTPAPQPISPEAEVIAYEVPADALINAFGPGTFLMRIYVEPGGSPIAEGRFELVAPAAS